MGLNTAMIVRNDFLHDVEEDPAFGQKVKTAVVFASHPEHAPYHGQSFDVLPPVHADGLQVVVIGGNGIRLMGVVLDYRASDESILRELADRMGFMLRRKPAPKGGE